MGPRIRRRLSMTSSGLKERRSRGRLEFLEIWKKKDCFTPSPRVPRALSIQNEILPLKPMSFVTLSLSQP
jgi:hypothetical protein